ncbi:hypothetical protein BH11ACT3_BH11ACT3_04050 [soil metagenome]
MSTPTVITVQGSHSQWFAAERGTVQVSVAFDGPDRAPVFEKATRATAGVTDALAGMLDADTGPVTRWSSDQVRVWSERPWNQQGKQLAPVFHAVIGVSARFSDFDALAGWVEKIATDEGVSVSSISWDLTDATRKTVTDDVRRAAVADALDKARVYASAVGLGEPRAVAIADVGMLSEQGPSPVSGGGMERMAFKSQSSPMMAMDAGGGLSFTPEKIEVSAGVDVRFSAS